MMTITMMTTMTASRTTPPVTDPTTIHRVLSGGRGDVSLTGGLSGLDVAFDVVFSICNTTTSVVIKDVDCYSVSE